MKRPLDEAAELFRENEALAGDDKERANLYRALGLLTEGVRRLEKELAEVEAERQRLIATLDQRTANLVSDAEELREELIARTRIDPSVG